MDKVFAKVNASTANVTLVSPLNAVSETVRALLCNVSYNIRALITRGNVNLTRKIRLTTTAEQL